MPGSNPEFAGEFTDFPDQQARTTLALGSGSGPVWFTMATVVGGPFQIGEVVEGFTTKANGLVYALDTTGTKIGLLVIDGEFAVGETLTGDTSGASTALTSLVTTTPVAKWGFPYRPKSDPLFIIYHHPNRRGMREIPGPGEPHPNPNMRVIDRTMLSGTFTNGEALVGDLLRITDITPYLTSLEMTAGSPYVSGEDFTITETVTGQTSGETATVVRWDPAAIGNPGSVLTVINESGTFTIGEIVTGDTSGVSLTIAPLGLTTIDADFVLGETVTGGTSGATGVVLDWTPVPYGQLGSVLVLGAIVSGPFSDGEDIDGAAPEAQITVDEIVEVQTTGIVDADELPSPGESQIIMFTGGEFQPGENMTGQLSGAVARVDSLSSLIYADGMPWRDIGIRDFTRNMRVAEGVLCVPTDEQEILSDAGYPNADIGGLDGTGPSE